MHWKSLELSVISIVVLPLLMYVGIKTFWKDCQRYKNLQGLNKPKY